MVVASLAIACGACGARNALDVAGATVGGGASSPGTSASIGSGAGPGSGGSDGGLPPSCSALARVEPIVGLEPTFSGGDADLLRLTPMRGDSGEVACVFVARAPGGQLIVHHTAFAPWPSWPADAQLGPVHATFDVVSSAPFAAPSAKAGRYALAVGVPGSYVGFFGENDPHVEGAGTLPEISLAGVDAECLAARAEGLSGPTHFAGVFYGGGNNVVDGHAVTTDAAIWAVPIGCASVQPARAAAVAWGEGWLVAVSSGAPFGNCPQPMPGLPEHIDLLLMGSSAWTPLASIMTGTVVDVAVAPHPAGAYVVWSDHDGAAGTQLHAARFSAAPPTLEAQADLTPADGSGASFVVAAMGSRLAVARRGSAGDLVVSIYDESLALLASTSFTPGVFTGPTSLLGAPSGDGVIVAWTSQDAHPWHGAMARFDCGP
jgi:hypothetical protein